MSADVFAPLRERVEFAAKWDATTIKLDQSKIMLLARLLSEHAEMTAHLMGCTATCKPADSGSVRAQIESIVPELRGALEAATCTTDTGDAKP